MLRKKNIKVVWVDDGFYIMFRKTNLKCLECKFGRKHGRNCSYSYIDEKTLYDICTNIENYAPIANPILVREN